MPERIAQYCAVHLDLQNAELGEEYYYFSLPFCIIDAVYSLGVRYSATRNTVIRFCGYQGLQRLRPKDSLYPDISKQYSVRNFEELLSGYGDYNQVASKVFDNHQRTSTRNGILKAEAVHRFAQVLLKHHVEYFQDIRTVVSSDRFESEICSIPGQTYGTSLTYFFMLSGEENMVKPDRMIRRFLRRVLGNESGQKNPQAWLQEALEILHVTYPALTLRLLDHEIWKYEQKQ
jgi:hypothetical protein